MTLSSVENNFADSTLCRRLQPDILSRTVSIVDSEILRSFFRKSTWYRERKHGYYKPISYEATIKDNEAIDSRFREITSSNDLQQFLSPAGGRAKLPRSSHRFGFTFLLPEYSKYLQESLSSNPYPVHRNGITCEYGPPPGKPYLDAKIGLGLTYDKRLVAVCVGGITRGKRLLVRQLQDVSSRTVVKEFDDRRIYNNGLQDGIDWRKTLVKAWAFSSTYAAAELIPQSQNPSIEFQSAVNNYWLQVAMKVERKPSVEIDQKIKRYLANYDETALRLGGSLDKLTGNFVLPVEIVSA